MTARVPGARQVASQARLVTRVVEKGVGPILLPARWGAEWVLAGLVRLLEQSEAPADELAGDAVTPAEPGRLEEGWLLDGRGHFTRVEVAERAGVDLHLARRLWRALGFPEADDDQRVFTSADVAALRDVYALIEADLVDEDGVVALARPVGHLLARLASAQVGVVSTVVGEQGDAGAPGPTPDELGDRAVAVTEDLLPVLERTTLYVWRRHLAAEAQRALQPAVLQDAAATSRQAVGFIDISGYTRLAQALDPGDLDALLERFEQLVLDTVVNEGGRVVKTLGDEVLFAASSAAAGAEIGLRLLERVAEGKDVPDVHVGIAYGQVLSRGGDVYGPVVNVAARLASLAGNGNIRVDQTMADQLRGDTRYDVSVRPPRRVRGYVALRNYRLRRKS